MICRLCVGVLTWQGLVISWSFSIGVKMPAKKEEDDENNYSKCVHLSTAQQDSDTSQLSVLRGKNIVRHQELYRCEEEVIFPNRELSELIVDY